MMLVGIKDEKTSPAGARDFPAQRAFFSCEFVDLMMPRVGDEGRQALLGTPMLVHQRAEAIRLSAFQSFENFVPELFDAMKAVDDFSVRVSNRPVLLAQYGLGLTGIAGEKKQSIAVELVENAQIYLCGSRVDRTIGIDF